MILVTGKVASLEHELRDDTVERAAGVSLLSDEFHQHPTYPCSPVANSRKFFVVLGTTSSYNLLLLLAYPKHVDGGIQGHTRRFCPWNCRWKRHQSKRLTCLLRCCRPRIEICRGGLL